MPDRHFLRSDIFTFTMFYSFYFRLFPLMNPEVLILDEPLAGLDESTQKMLIDFLKKFHAAGKTLIIITHNNQLAKELGTRFIKMNENHELTI